MLTTAKILSSPTKRDWTQSYEEDGVVALFSLEGGSAEGNSAVEVGKRAYDFFKEEFANNTDTNPLSKLKSAKEKTEEEFKNYNLAIAACFQSEKNYIYFIRSGKTQIWAQRDNTVYNLSGESFSGKIKEGDLFILATKTFFSSIKPEVLNLSLLAKSPLEVAENLSPLAHSLNNAKAGAIVVKPTPNAAPIQEVEEVQTAPPLPVQTTAPVAQSQTTNPVLGGIRHLLVRFAYLLPERQFSAKVNGPRDPKKTALSVGAVLLIILLISIVLGIRQKKGNDYKAAYQDRLVRAQSLYSDSISQKDTNLIGARESFNSAQDIVSALVEEGIKDPEIEKLKNDLLAIQTEILGTAHIPAMLFLDLSLARSGVEAKDLSLSQDKISALDISGGRVITVNAKTKETSVSGSSDKVSDSKSVSMFDGKIYVLAGGGIVEIDSKGVSKVVIENDSEWSSPAKVFAFGSNIYLLENGGKIWKYPAAGTPTGFGSKQAWLKADPGGSAVDWAIDGAVYVLGQGGDAVKYIRGTKDSFHLSGFSNSLSGATAIYTDPDLDSVFVMDRAGGRILEVEKNGSFKLEYIADEIKTSDDFVVSNPQRKIFLLSQNKILEIPLKK